MVSKINADLRKVNALITGGNLEGARNELLRLAKHGEATNHISRFVDFSLKLKKPEIVEAFLSDSLLQPARALILFNLVDLYHRLGDRRNAFRHLQDLVTNCADSQLDLRKVATCYAQLGEVSHAREIREKLLRGAPSDYLLALDIIEDEIRSKIELGRNRLDKVWALSELNKLMRTPELPAAVWKRASNLYGSLGETRARTQAIQKAVTLHDSGPKERFRLAMELARKGETRRARAELAHLLIACRTDPKLLRWSGDLAFRLPDRELALQFAEAQYQCKPTDPECVLYIAYHLRMSGDRFRAQELLSSLFNAQRQGSSLSDQQWVRLAEELSAIGDIALGKEALAKAVARTPDSRAARAIAAKAALLQTFGKTIAPTVHRTGESKQVRLSFFSRLRKLF